ncbi:restriction endonuclease subunit S [Microcoleus sp. w2-18bC1]|uniref:restriction endonuclease subunit S n=1 Tax=unclassified Microcoleus TaxID=2642155 RepID=UPI002FD5E855
MTEDRDNLPELPTGWVWVSWEQIGFCQNGRAFPSKEYQSSGVKLLRPGNLHKSGNVLWTEENTRYLPEQYAKEFPSYIVGSEELIINLTAQSLQDEFLGRICLTEKSEYCLLNQRIARLTPIQIPPRYLLWLFKSRLFRKFVDSLNTGSLIQHMFTSQIEKFNLPLPPLNEQRRIVAKIEALKARSQLVKEELEAIPVLLDQFRQSVLAAAFRGDLTADWREKNPDVEPASVLLERIRAERRRRWEEAELEKMKAQGKTPKDDKWKEKYKEFLPVNNPSVFEKSVIPTQWSWVTIGDVAECLDKMRVPINKDEREKRIGDIPYYGANGQVGWIDDYIFDEALVVVVEDETFIGRTKPFCYKISGKSWVNNHAHVLRATDGVEIDYVNYSLMFYPFIPLTSGSTGRRKLTQAALMSAPYPVAPLAEQQEIVRRVELFFKTAEQIEQQYQEAKAYLDKLNQSILTKAFRGELVPQNPNDEPASVLLERIRAEWEKLDTKKKAKGKTEKKSCKAKPEAKEPKQLSLPGFE